jgi:hypothetical protein
MVAGIPSRLRQNWLMLMLQGYIDDSGSDMQGPVYVLSGFIGQTTEWAKFSDQWDIELHKPPAISYFKMREAESLKEQFQGWTIGDRDAKIMSLTRLIVPRVICNVECVVSQADYDSVVPRAIAFIRKTSNAMEDRRLANSLENPYLFCFHGIVIECCNRLYEQRQLDVIDFYFDQQGKVGNRAKAFWYALKNNAPPEYKRFLVNEPVFRDEKIFLPLQAADLIAWQTRRRIDDLNERAIDNIRAPLKYVRERVPLFVNRWNGERLKDFLHKSLHVPLTAL